MSAAFAIDRIRELFGRLGARAYTGEPVTQLEHALQSAALAQAAGAAEALVAGMHTPILDEFAQLLIRVAARSH